FNRSGSQERTPMSVEVIPTTASPMSPCYGYSMRHRKPDSHSNLNLSDFTRLSPIHLAGSMIRVVFYRYSPRRVDRLPVLPYPIRTLIACTVFERMTQGQYAPISIHGPIDCIGGNGSVPRRYNDEAMEIVLDTVWWRRTAYWVMVFISGLILRFPWLS